MSIDLVVFDGKGNSTKITSQFNNSTLLSELLPVAVKTLSGSKIEDLTIFEKVGNDRRELKAVDKVQDVVKQWNNANDSCIEIRAKGDSPLKPSSKIARAQASALIGTAISSALSEVKQDFKKSVKLQIEAEAMVAASIRYASMSCQVMKFAPEKATTWVQSCVDRSVSLARNLRNLSLIFERQIRMMEAVAENGASHVSKQDMEDEKRLLYKELEAALSAAIEFEQSARALDLSALEMDAQNKVKHLEIELKNAENKLMLTLQKESQTKGTSENQVAFELASSVVHQSTESANVRLHVQNLEKALHEEITQSQRRRSELETALETEKQATQALIAKSSSSSQAKIVELEDKLETEARIMQNIKSQQAKEHLLSLDALHAVDDFVAKGKNLLERQVHVALEAAAERDEAVKAVAAHADKVADLEAKLVKEKKESEEHIRSLETELKEERQRSKSAASSTSSTTLDKQAALKFEAALLAREITTSQREKMVSSALSERIRVLEKQLTQEKDRFESLETRMNAEKDILKKENQSITSTWTSLKETSESRIKKLEEELLLEKTAVARLMASRDREAEEMEENKKLISRLKSKLAAERKEVEALIALAEAKEVMDLSKNAVEDDVAHRYADNNNKHEDYERVCKSLAYQIASSEAAAVTHRSMLASILSINEEISLKNEVLHAEKKKAQARIESLEQSLEQERKAMKEMMQQVEITMAAREAAVREVSRSSDADAELEAALSRERKLTEELVQEVQKGKVANEQLVEAKKEIALWTGRYEELSKGEMVAMKKRIEELEENLKSERAFSESLVVEIEAANVSHKAIAGQDYQELLKHAEGLQRALDDALKKQADRGQQHDQDLHQKLQEQRQQFQRQIEEQQQKYRAQIQKLIAENAAIRVVMTSIMATSTPTSSDSAHEIAKLKTESLEATAEILSHSTITLALQAAEHRVEAMTTQRMGKEERLRLQQQHISEIEALRITNKVGEFAILEMELAHALKTVEEKTRLVNNLQSELKGHKDVSDVQRQELLEDLRVKVKNAITERDLAIKREQRLVADLMAEREKHSKEHKATMLQMTTQGILNAAVSGAVQSIKYKRNSDKETDKQSSLLSNEIERLTCALKAAEKDKQGWEERVHTLQQDIIDNRTKLAEARVETSEERSHRKAMEQQLEHERALVTEMQDHLTAEKNRFAAIQSETGLRQIAHFNKIRDLEEKLRLASASLEAATKAVAEKAEKIKDLQNQLKSARDEVQAARDASVKIQAHYSGEMRSLEEKNGQQVQQLESQIQKLRSAAVEQQQQQQQHIGQKEVSQQQQQRLQELQGRLARAESRLTELQGIEHESKKRFENEVKLKARIQELEKQVSSPDHDNSNNNRRKQTLSPRRTATSPTPGGYVDTYLPLSVPPYFQIVSVPISSRGRAMSPPPAFLRATSPLRTATTVPATIRTQLFSSTVVGSSAAAAAAVVADPKKTRVFAAATKNDNHPQSPPLRSTSPPPAARATTSPLRYSTPSKQTRSNNNNNNMMSSPSFILAGPMDSASTATFLPPMQLPSTAAGATTTTAPGSFQFTHFEPFGYPSSLYFISTSPKRNR